MRVYIINGRDTRKKLDNRSHHGYFMVYADTTGVVLYYNPYQTIFIHRNHHVWFDEYNSCLFIEDNYTPSYLLLKQYPESHVHNSDLLNLITCELDLTSTPFCDTKILTYKLNYLPLEIELVLTYWMMKTLQYRISMIQSQIHQPVINYQHRLKKYVDH